MFFWATFKLTVRTGDANGVVMTKMMVLYSTRYVITGRIAFMNQMVKSAHSVLLPTGSFSTTILSNLANLYVTTKPKAKINPLCAIKWTVQLATQCVSTKGNVFFHSTFVMALCGLAVQINLMKTQTCVASGFVHRDTGNAQKITHAFMTFMCAMEGLIAMICQMKMTHSA